MTYVQNKLEHTVILRLFMECVKLQFCSFWTCIQTRFTEYVPEDILGSERSAKSLEHANLCNLTASKNESKIHFIDVATDIARECGYPQPWSLKAITENENVYLLPEHYTVRKLYRDII